MVALDVALLQLQLVSGVSGHRCLLPMSPGYTETFLSSWFLSNRPWLTAGKLIPGHLRHYREHEHSPRGTAGTAAQTEALLLSFGLLRVKTCEMQTELLPPPGRASSPALW